MPNNGVDTDNVTGGDAPSKARAKVTSPCISPKGTSGNPRVQFSGIDKNLYALMAGKAKYLSYYYRIYSSIISIVYTFLTCMLSKSKQ